MKAPAPAQPRWLRELLARTDRAAAVAALWEGLAAAPVLGETRDGLTEVTFLWRQHRDDLEVLVHVNGLTDAMRADVSPALAEHVPGTDLWHLSWWLPTDGTWGYRFVQLPEIPRDSGATREGWLAIHEAGVTDPLNPAWQPHALGESTSLLALPAAYQHPAWRPAPSITQPWTHAEITPFDGESRGVHLWSPPQGEPQAVLVLLDGEQWAAMGVADAVAEAAMPVDLVLVDSVDHGLRARDLPSPERAATLVAAALQAHTAATGRAHDPERSIVAGQSYGGLAAAGTVLTRPDLARTAISQSGSYWYRDGEQPRRDNPHPGDLSRALADGDLGSPDVRLVLQAGTDEGTMAHQSQLMHEAAQRQGIESALTIVTGGHDYAWWKHHLLRALEDLDRARRVAPEGAIGYN